MNVLTQRPNRSRIFQNQYGGGKRETLASQTLAFPDVARDTSAAYQSTPDGFRAIVSLDSPRAKNSLAFPLELPKKGTMRLQPDGSVEIFRSNGSTLGSFLKPWAIDGNGRQLSTSCRISGNKLIQDINTTGATYPILADPDYVTDCGWVTCTRWTSVATTKWLYDNRMNSTNATWAAAAGLTCGAGSLIWGPGGFVCFGWYGYIIVQLNTSIERAAANRGCMKFKYSRQLGKGFPTSFSWTTPNQDGRCKWS